MININISLSFESSPQSVMMKVKPWDDPQMQADGFSAVLRGNVGQFQVVTPYIENADGVWCGTWSSNSNFSTMGHADIIKLANTQLLDFGFEWGMTESEVIAALDAPLDGYTLRAKMGWLINQSNVWGQQMRCSGDWWTAERIDFIGMVHGGQSVMVSNTIEYKNVTFNGKKELMPMRRLQTFRRSDWGKTWHSHPYLIQKATVAQKDTNKYGDSPKGVVYCPVALSYPDFDFASNFQPARYYLADRWLE